MEQDPFNSSDGHGGVDGSLSDMSADIHHTSLSRMSNNYEAGTCAVFTSTVQAALRKPQKLGVPYDRTDTTQQQQKTAEEKTGSSESNFNTKTKSSSQDEKLEEKLTNPSSASLSLLESLDDYVSSHIYCNLDLNEISKASQVSKRLLQACRSNALWKDLFHERWNVQREDDPQEISTKMQKKNNSDGDQFYFRAYVEAHLHPHDLWITHVNCVPPWDGIAADRCGLKNQSDPAGAVFQSAGTFYRKPSPKQYSPGLTNFLTDLLFFNMTDPGTVEGQMELKTLLEECGLAEIDDTTTDLPRRSNAPPPSPQHELLETTHHSWHVIRLFNPSFFKPLVFTTGVARPECFAIYPSEGWIGPGESMTIVSSVRPVGACLAYAFERLNVEREALDAEWADIYTQHAHLPYTPYLIRYRFVHAPPGTKYDPSSTLITTGTIQNWQGQAAARDGSAVDQSHQNSKKKMLEYFTIMEVPPHEFRSITLSAHVHAHYNFWDFYQQTAIASTAVSGVLPALRLLAPQLGERYPVLYRKAAKRVDEHVLAAAREEAAAHVQDRLAKQELKIKNITTALNAIDSMKFSELEQSSESSALLLCAIWSTVQSVKAMPRIDDGLCDHSSSLFELEQVIERIYAEKVKVGGEVWHPWRLSGLYRHRLCTDSVVCDDNTKHYFRDGKLEPSYLKALANLTHGPGQFCLGRQVDRNHDMVGDDDIFMNDAVSNLQAGICLMQDPRSLVVHGVFDRIMYPGSLVRRPKLLPSATEEQKYRNNFVGESLEYTLLRYVHGAPPPGVGLFPLTRYGFGDSAELSIIQATLDDEDGGKPELVAHFAAGSVHGQENQDDPINVPRDAFGRMQFQQPVAPNNNGPRGLRLFHLLWLLGAQAGLVVIDNAPGGPTIYVNRSILIASQWISVSIGLAPFLWILVARFLQWIPACPVGHNLDRLPFVVDDEMRFLTPSECGWAAVILGCIWLSLARWAERHSGRDFFRVIKEYVWIPRSVSHGMFTVRLFHWLRLWYLRQWDSFCPLFLQRRIFTPCWNKRTPGEFMRHIAGWRSREWYSNQRKSAPAKFALVSQKSVSYASVTLGPTSSAYKIFVGVIMVLGSFCSSSPHFWLNAMSIFSCSISLGMSVSVDALEKGRLNISVGNNNHNNNSLTGSLLKELNLVSVALLAALVGQLVGSSGGTYFLLEFLVTSISMLVGGAGTVSASTMESWFCFLGLSCVAFWGYLFGRVALVDGLQQKRPGYTSILLSKVVIFIFLFWVLVFFVTRFDSHVSLVIHNVPRSNTRSYKLPPSFSLSTSVWYKGNQHSAGNKTPLITKLQ